MAKKEEEEKINQMNQNHSLSLSQRNDKIQYINRGLYDTFNLLIGISITLLFIYKLRKIN